MRRHRLIGTVGILMARAEAPGFTGETFCRELNQAGRRMELDVFVFTPKGLRLGAAVTAFRPRANGDGWYAQQAALPDLVYDRHFAVSRLEHESYRRALRLLAQHVPRVRLLGGGLPAKRDVQRMLARDAELAAHLPPTIPLRSASVLIAELKSRRDLFLKPDSGSQGRGAFRVSAATGGGSVLVRGRTPRNAPFARRFVRTDDFASWIMSATRARSYLIQPYLPLVDREGIAYDIRCLMQKDGTGHWRTTGFAARRGQAGSVTANLHGGGQAEPASAMLESQFGADEAGRIMQTLERLAARVPVVLEEQRGRLCELGIDFGVSSCGGIWLIEVNSKPGRSAFARIGAPAMREAAVLSPLRYARALLRAAAAQPTNGNLHPSDTKPV